MKPTRRLKYFALLTGTSAMVWSAATYAVAPTNDSMQKPSIEVHLEALNQLRPAAAPPPSGQMIPVPFEVKSKSEYQTAPVVNMVSRDDAGTPPTTPAPILPLESTAPTSSAPIAMQITPVIPPAPMHSMDQPALPPRVTHLPAPIPPKNLQAAPQVMSNQPMPRHATAPILPPNAPPALPYRASPTLSYQTPSSQNEGWWGETTNFVGGLFGADETPPPPQTHAADPIPPNTLSQPLPQPVQQPVQPPAAALPAPPTADTQAPLTIAPAPLAPSGLSEAAPNAYSMEPIAPAEPMEFEKPAQLADSTPQMMAEPSAPSFSAIPEAPAAVPILITPPSSPVQDNVATYDGYELAEGLAGAPQDFDATPDLSFDESMAPPPAQQTMREPTLPVPTYDGSETLLGQIGQDNIEQDTGEPISTMSADSGSPAALSPPPAMDYSAADAPPTAQALAPAPTSPLPTPPAAVATPEIMANAAPEVTSDQAAQSTTPLAGNTKEDQSWFKGMKNDLEGYFADEEKAQEQSKLAADNTAATPPDTLEDLTTPESTKSYNVAKEKFDTELAQAKKQIRPEISADQTSTLATPESFDPAPSPLPSLPGTAAAGATSQAVQAVEMLAETPKREAVKITKLDPTIQIKADLEAKQALEAKKLAEAKAAEEAEKAAQEAKAAARQQAEEAKEQAEMAEAKKAAEAKKIADAKAAAEAEKAAAAKLAEMEKAKKQQDAIKQAEAAKAAQKKAEVKQLAEAKAAEEAQKARQAAELAAAAKAQEAEKIAAAKKAAKAEQEAKAAARQQAEAAKAAKEQAKIAEAKQLAEAKAAEEAQQARKAAELAAAAKAQQAQEAQEIQQAQATEAKTLAIAPKSEKVDLQRDEQAAEEVTQEVEAPVQLASLPDKKTMAENIASATSTLSFSGNATDLAPGSESQLNQLAAELKQSESTRLSIRAYAAAEEGQEVLARRIALARGLAVRAYLIEQGVNALRINVQSVGNSQGMDTKNEVELELKKVGGA